MEENIDINMLIQTFSERITALTNDIVVKDTIIKQLTAKIESLTKEEDKTKE